MPDSVLLFAARGQWLQLAIPAGSQLLKLPVELPLNYGVFNYPSLAPDGERVAWGFAVASDPGNSAPPRFVLGIRAATQQEWQTVGDFTDIGAAAISPDDSKIAFVSEQKERKTSLVILNTSTGEMATIAHPSGVPERAGLSWSPSGKEMAVEIQRGDQLSDIAVVDTRTEDVKVIGKGVDPVWSPTGEWIAYSDETRQKCSLVRPDGTDSKVVRDVRKVFGYRMFVYGAVWSPDGKQLLLNEMKGEGPNLDVMLLDLASGKVTTKSRNGLPVFGWAREKR